MIPIESILKEYLSKVFTGHVKNNNPQVSKQILDPTDIRLNDIENDLGGPINSGSINSGPINVSSPINDDFGVGGQNDEFLHNDFGVGKDEPPSKFRDDDDTTIFKNDDDFLSPTTVPSSEPNDFLSPTAPNEAPNSDPFSSSDDFLSSPNSDPFLSSDLFDVPSPLDLRKDLSKSDIHDIHFFDDLP